MANCNIFPSTKDMKIIQIVYLTPVLDFVHDPEILYGGSRQGGQRQLAVRTFLQGGLN